ncbi:MAG: hypothetical protein ACO29U_02220 [Crocinitomicaceae bacterium]
MNILKYIGFSCICCLALLSCEPKVSVTNPSKGELDMTSVLFIGDGQTGGYMDDGLTEYGQENALAVILANQFKLIGGSDANLPWINSSSIGISTNGQSPLHLGYKTDCKGVTSLSPLRVASTGDLSCLSQSCYNANLPFNVFGIPGLRVHHFTNPSFASLNPYYNRMCSSPNATVLSELLAQNARFFQLYIGLEDVLDYAKSGGTHQSLPSLLSFQQNYEQIVQNLTSNGAKGVLASIPDITKMPYFTTIPWNGLNLDATNVGTLNNIYNPLGFYFQLGSNPFMMVDSTANMFAVRQMESSEILLLNLPLDSVKCHQMGVLFPIRDEFILDNSELAILRGMIQQYNQIISQIAQTYHLALVDTDEFLSKLVDGFTYNGVNLSARFVSGGAYSLDGIYLNPKGNALFANEFIKAINKTYHSSIPEVNANLYSGVRFP